MSRVFSYYHRFQGVRGSVLGLPTWARGILTIVALPAIIALALSIVAFVASLLALLAITVPVYSLLRAMVGRPMEAQSGAEFLAESGFPRGPAKHVDVTVHDAAADRNESNLIE